VTLICVTFGTSAFPIPDAFRLCAKARKIPGLVREETPEEMGGGF